MACTLPRPACRTVVSFVAAALTLLLPAPARAQGSCEPAWVPTFSSVGQGLDGHVETLVVFDDGSGPALYAGGQFTTESAPPASHVARWDGAAWSALGSGVNGLVRTLAVFDDGAGPALYAGGFFSMAGGGPVGGIARWDGSAWRALGAGVSGGPVPHVAALAVFDDGGGPALYAGGRFTAAGGVAATNVARWDGSAWSALAPGINTGEVRALAVHDDGGGPALYAGGTFFAIGGVLADCVARWDGAAWAPLGSGVSGVAGKEALSVFDLHAYDDGGGEALYVGGNFLNAGDAPAQRLARWQGGAWSPLGSGLSFFVFGDARGLASFDDGSGEALYVTGQFTHAGGTPANHIARWDGQAYAPLGAGLLGGGFALAAFDAGDGPDLYVGGLFSSSAAGDAVVARWDGCAGASPWEDLGGGTAGVSGVPALALSGPLVPGSPLGLDLVDGAPSTLALLLVSLSSTPAPFLGGTLHAFPQPTVFVLATDGAGELHGATTFPGGAPSGAAFFFQVALQDASVPLFGGSLSNGVKGTTP